MNKISKLIPRSIVKIVSSSLLIFSTLLLTKEGPPSVFLIVFDFLIKK